MKALGPSHPILKDGLTLKTLLSNSAHPVPLAKTTSSKAQGRNRSSKHLAKSETDAPRPWVRAFPEHPRSAGDTPDFPSWGQHDSPPTPEFSQHFPGEVEVGGLRKLHLGETHSSAQPGSQGLFQCPAVWAFVDSARDTSLTCLPQITTQAPHGGPLSPSLTLNRTGAGADTVDDVFGIIRRASCPFCWALTASQGDRSLTWCLESPRMGPLASAMFTD